MLSDHDVDLIRTKLQDIYNQAKSEELSNEKN